MHALVGASSVHSVVRVTGNFTSENPLHPAAREALLAAFDQGWADPKKLSQSSARAAILRNQSLENIAGRLGLPVASIEILGEPSLGHYLSIAGLFTGSSAFAYSAVDKGKIRAIARAHSTDVIQLPVNASGALQDFESIPRGAVLSLQLANAETGVIQGGFDAIPASVRIALDATASGPRIPLPERWSTALFDATSWNGPGGLAIMAVKNSADYSYPLPHIAPIRTPGSSSLPLLIASSIALENFSEVDTSLRAFALAEFGRIDGVHSVAPDAAALPHLFSIVVQGVAGERVVRELATQGIDIDSGSACSPEDLQPSHVLAAMGYETSGHLRFTLHQGVTERELQNLVRSVSEVIQRLRG